jgi:hypothetical protein
MKRSKFSEEQIAFALRQAESGTPVADVNGAPVAPRTGQGELGHRSGDMIEQVDGRLGTVRHRSESVEYRVEEVAPPLVPVRHLIPA